MSGQNEAVVDWIRAAAIPLATVEPRQGFADLEPFRAIIGDARIVSLGEATHGTREFFKLKHRLLEFCVAELGFTMFGIEASFSESLAVNAYVLDGVGHAGDALAGMRYWVWDTQEVLDLIEWMRQWNARNRRKVKFYGFVTGRTTVPVLELLDFLARVAPDLAKDCKTRLGPLTSDFTSGLLEKLTEARRRDMQDCIAQVLEAFEEQRTHWSALTSADDWSFGRLHTILLAQGAKFELEGVAADHDQAMADTVCALLEAEGPHTKAVLWAHNDHAASTVDAHGYKSMGRHLKERFGREQVIVGTAFVRGAFRARSYLTGALTVHSVNTALPDSFEHFLAQAGPAVFAVDLLNAPREGEAAAWLATEMPIRAIGGIYGVPPKNRYKIKYTRTMAPRDYFDVVVLVAETTAARPNQQRLAQAITMHATVSNLELSGGPIPTGWSVVGAPLRYGHTITVTEDVSPGGGRTVCLRRNGAPWRWGEGQLVQKVSARPWLGLRLRFSAALRTVADEPGAGALLFVRFLPKADDDGPGSFFGPLATEASTAAPAHAIHWTTHAVEANVPEAADTFLVGLVMTGAGAAWFGDLELAHVP